MTMMSKEEQRVELVCYCCYAASAAAETEAETQAAAATAVAHLLSICVFQFSFLTWPNVVLFLFISGHLLTQLENKIKSNALSSFLLSPCFFLPFCALFRP